MATGRRLYEYRNSRHSQHRIGKKQGAEGMRSGAPDLLVEAHRLLDASRAQGVTIRLIGGLAIRLQCPSAARDPLVRSYKDLDFVGRSNERPMLEEFFDNQGYAADRRFNALNGHRRLLFWDQSRSRQVDVILDQFEMCHRLDLRDRMARNPQTLPVSDLLLMKMQVVEANDKDLLDSLAVLVDHPLGEDDEEGINGDYLARLCASDWGLYRTLQLNRGRIEEYADRLSPTLREVLMSRLREMFERIEAEPKTLAWKLRARIGDRIRWYELPEEVR